jgi:hypothetical protein
MMNVLLIAALILASSGKGSDVRPRTPEAELLRRYGHALCLAKGYKGTPTGDDAERSADLYRQEGRATFGPYEEVRKAAEALDPAKPSVVDKRNFAIVACLEFYDSVELKKLIRRALARPHAFP